MPLLPFNRCPGTDLLSKGVLSSSSVIRIVEDALNLPEHEYAPTINEWWTGKRSYVVLAANSENPPSVISEVQNSITDSSMRTLIDYCRAAEKKTGVLPKDIVFNSNTISKSVTASLKKSSVEGCQTYPCVPWARCCYIFSKHLVKGIRKNGYLMLGKRIVVLSSVLKGINIK